ncbi:multicopper oxidase family protein [Streptomyces inhibens]|uniref:Multicopper oxidase family protein n=1 Tax=Streptomyces inhibens TaxID=2293571 RepID=A0A371PX78_STRIH|nr:multicopper oxidase family protein [Streptomyces inhibens]REK87085.1 multicopper oxidase family protein [Streptomyces inhibens]
MRTHSRRALLGAGIAVAGSGLLTACATGASGSGRQAGPDGKNVMDHSHDSGDVPPGYVSPDGPEVAETERKRGAGPVRHYSLTAAETRLDLGGRTVRTWAYGDELPGKELRITAGDRMALTLANHLPQSTTLHWHGLAVRNDMDGVPGLTQRSVKPGATFDYHFAVTDPGTHWVHPHYGVQLDRGLYTALIVEDPREPLSYDQEWVVMIDDWLDGIDDSTPDAVLTELHHGRNHHGMGHEDMDDGPRTRGGGGTTHGAHGKGGQAAAPSDGPSRVLKDARSRLLRGIAGDVDHPYHLINGRTAEDPQTFRARPGDRIRIRFINAGSDTCYRVALGGHRMTVTHTDGRPVEHATTDALLIGMSERYDVMVTVKDGVFPLTALAEGKNRTALALLRTGSGEAPGPSVRPKRLFGKLVTADRLRAAESVRAVSRRPDRTIDMTLTGSMKRFDWSINRDPYSSSQRYPVEAGERVRIIFRNHSRMWHPMHVHGHTFALPDGGPRKDTMMVLPGRRIAVDFDANNPGLWMVHCHNLYHSESGMMTVMGYRKT